MRLPQRRRTRGQALMEMALALPFLVVLVAGAAQFSFLAYSGVTVQTAAREGARIASQNPDQLQPSPPNCPSTPPPSGGSTGNAVCDAIYRGAGLLSGSTLNITVTAPSTVSLAPADVVPVVAGGCNGSTITVTGAVSPAQTANITDNSANNNIIKSTLSDGTFFLCLAKQGSYTDIVYFSAQGCLSTQASVQVAVKNGGATPNPIPTVSLTPATCTATTATSTTLTTASNTNTNTSTSAQSISQTTSATTCAQTLNGQYVTVTVSYDAPIFVPFLGFALGTSGHRTMTATVTMRIDSCTAAAS